MSRTLILALLSTTATGQQAGTVKKESHPSFQLGVCTTADGCRGESTTVTMDANWRWVHNTGGYTNCFNESGWNPAYCSDSNSCSKNCALDGVTEEDWSATYGVNATSGGFKLGLVTGGNVGSRFYLLDSEDQNKYRMFNLKNREFAFDVDVSSLDCGINGALYFVEMAADGGEAGSSGLNKAGAAYGTGYCDAQCANDIKFIGGLANLNETYGSCCAEMDIWEANKQAAAYTAHPCALKDQLRCEGDNCKTSCDMAGCDFNSYRNGVTTAFGPGDNYDIDTTQPITVVTQFITSDGTDTGDLQEIRRVYKQNGKEIPNAKTNIDGLSAYDSLTDDNCAAQKIAFQEDNTFKSHGGMKAMGDAMARGMVLVFSLWDDNAAHMLWLDSVYPKGAKGAGAKRGPCAENSGVPADVEKEHASAFVSYTNIKFGEIGSTAGPVPSPTPSPTPSSACCSWDGKYCGKTSDYCNHSASQCADCSGSWCLDCLPPYTPSPSPTPKPSPTPTPSNCPGGSLMACIDMCPASVYAECVQSCSERCGSVLL